MRQEGMSYTFLPTAYIGGKDRLGRPCVGPRPMDDICQGKLVAGVWWSVPNAYFLGVG